MKDRAITLYLDDFVVKPDSGYENEDENSSWIAWRGAFVFEVWQKNSNEILEKSPTDLKPDFFVETRFYRMFDSDAPTPVLFFLFDELQYIDDSKDGEIRIRYERN